MIVISFGKDSNLGLEFNVFVSIVSEVEKVSNGWLDVQLNEPIPL